MTPLPVVFAAGVPRSGTVLVSAMIRHLFSAAGHRVALANPHGGELPQLLAALAGPDRPDAAVVIHTHSWDAETARRAAATPWITGFLCRRDPRDVCVSLMRLHDQAFDEALALTRNAFAMFETAVRDSGWPVIDYAALVADRRAHIRRLAAALGVPAPARLVRRIDDATSVERHAGVMRQVAAGELETLRERRNRHRVLREDSRTLINDRHIQSGRPGRWKAELTELQQRRAEELLARWI